MFDLKTLHQMGARAAHFYERRRSLNSYNRSEAESIERKLSLWKDSCANGNEQEFERRLKLEGLNPETAKQILGDPAIATDASLPEWTLFLGELVRYASAHPEQALLQQRLSREGKIGYPFYEIWLPFVSYACQQLQGQLRTASRVTTNEALITAEKYLLRILSHNCAHVLNLEFDVFKAMRSTALGRSLTQISTQSQDIYYKLFVASFDGNRYASLFKEYAVLARQIVALIQGWISFIAEFHLHLNNDFVALANKFHLGKPLPLVCDIKPGGSDRHNGGRTTILVIFENGLKLIYKPKPLDTDIALENLIAWINSRAELLEIKTPSSLTRQDYGWQAWIDNEPCFDDTAVKRFYIRSGYLLCLVYMMEGYDCHHENLVACNEHLYLVDTETIFNPYKELESISSSEANAVLIAGKQVFYSVVRTGMLPAWSMRLNGKKRDTSGFGGGAIDGNDPVESLKWINVGSDDIQLDAVTRKIETLANMPYLHDGNPIPSDDYVEEIIAGFQDMYAFLSRHRITLKEKISKWRDLKVRYVRHATYLYADIMRTLSNPKFLRDGADWHIAADKLSSSYLAAEKLFKLQPGTWNMLESEMHALMHWDIPYFFAKTSSLDTFDGKGNRISPDYFQETCLQRLLKKLDELNPRDEALQIRYINYAFYARKADSFHDRHTECNLAHTSTAHQRIATRDECIGIAQEIGDELLKEAFRAPDGSLTWIALEYIKEMDAFQFKPVSFNLYSGSVGIALFLASLHRITGEAKYDEACRAACAPILKVLSEELHNLIDYSGIGGGVGVGSLIYGLTATGKLLQATEFINAARDCALALTPAAVARDKKYDLIFGAAGCVLGLLKLYAISQDTDVLDKALLCADHLIAARNVQINGRQLIPTFSDRVVTGLSHGASGIALAFMRLYQHTNEQRFYQAAIDHVAFEEEMYEQSLNNYLDYRSQPGTPSTSTAWCHGTPGIGLGLLHINKIQPGTVSNDRIDRDMTSTDIFTLEHMDHICCGNFGRLDILAEYAEYKHDQSMRNNVLRKASWTIDRYRKDEGFALFVNKAHTKVFSPGLFVGSSGIAYNLLRLAEPGQLSSVLAFE